MAHRMKATIALLVTVIASALADAHQTNQEKASLALKDLDGRPQSLSDHRGQIVVLNFWATWCVPCREEMPILIWAHNQYAGRGVRVIGVSTDDARTQPKVPAFVRQMKLNFPVWLGATTADMQRLELGKALPATAIIDRDGRIVGRIIGVVDKADLQKRIEWLLGDRKTPPPPPTVNKLEKQDEHGHKSEEKHEHEGAGRERASSVPS